MAALRQQQPDAVILSSAQRVGNHPSIITIFDNQRLPSRRSAGSFQPASPSDSFNALVLFMPEKILLLEKPSSL
jgi:hypothetical protein